MTYERLKVIVSVSLVLFIFIVGGILASGFLQKIYDNSLLKTKLKNNQPDLNTIITNTKKNDEETVPSPTIKTSEENQKKDASSQTSQPAKKTTQTVSIRRRVRRRTRAS